MNDTSSDQHAAITRQLRRLRRLTVISLIVNAVVLFLLLGTLLHHWGKKHHHDGQRAHPDFAREDSRGGFYHHHFMDRGDWGRRGDFYRPGGRDEEGRDFDRPEADRPGFGPGRGPDFGGPGDEGGGFVGHRRGMGMGMMGAGGPPDPARMTDGILEHLDRQLTLTDDQKAKIKPIVAAGVAQFQKDAEDRKAAMRKQIDDAKAKIKSLLNADQQKQFDAMPMPGQSPPGGPEPVGK